MMDQQSRNRTDVVVIGGGIIGLCCAYYLNQAGASVRVLDKGSMDEGASHVNAGFLVPSHIEPMAAPGVIAQGLKWLANPESPFYIKPRFDLDLTAWLLGFYASCTREHLNRSIPVLRDLALEGLALYDDVCRDPAFDGAGPKYNGLLMLHSSDYSERHNLEFAKMADDAGLQVRRLNREETLDLEPGIKTSITGSVFCEQDASLDPGHFVMTLRSFLESEGVQFLGGTEVTDITRSGNQITGIKTTRGSLDADHLVLAAGAWSGRLAKKVNVKLPLQPATGYSISVDDADEKLSIPLISTEEKITIGPMRGKIRFAGTLTLVGFDSKIDRVRLRPIQRQVKLYFPDVASGDQPMPEAQSGFRPCSTDGLPIIGRPDSFSNLYLATGHGMLGMTQGLITGQTIAKLVAGEKPRFDIPELSPNRF
jgi:D-amino-acid dehydrogenase